MLAVLLNRKEDNSNFQHYMFFLTPFILNYTKLWPKQFFLISRGNNRKKSPKFRNLISLKFPALLRGQVGTIKPRLLQPTKTGRNNLQLVQSFQLALNPLCFIYATKKKKKLIKAKTVAGKYNGMLLVEHFASVQLHIHLQEFTILGNHN